VFLEIDALIARGLQVLIALGGAYFLALWFVLIVWTFRDIEARSRSVITQVLSTLLVVLFWIPGLALYWVLRPKETLDEAYQRSLEEEYLLQDLEELPLCPNCQHFVEDDFQICPHCQTQLKDNCPHCERLVDLRWPVCPYCGEQQHHHHDHAEHDKVDDAGDRWIDPSAIEERLRKQEELRTRTEPRALPMATATIESVRDLLGGVNRRSGDSSSEETETVIPAAPGRSQDAVHANGVHDEAEADAPEPGEGVEANATDSAPVNGVVAEGESDASDTGSDMDEAPTASKPGPTRVPKRFKVN
jgi:RNA polymerase subunit RPABC4/transcription elongation factor Spt4